MQQAETDFLAILSILAEHRVEFIVVGGISAVLQGAPIATFDLDVVHSLGSENVRRLLKALAELGASYRTEGSRNLKPDASHLASSGHQLPMTRFGPLDLLGSIGKGRRYDELVTNSQVMQIGRGLVDSARQERQKDGLEVNPIRQRAYKTVVARDLER